MVTSHSRRGEERASDVAGFRALELNLITIIRSARILTVISVNLGGLDYGAGGTAEGGGNLLYFIFLDFITGPLAKLEFGF